MVNKEIIRRRLAALSEYLTFLSSLSSKYDEEQFVSNPEAYGSAERFLQLAIECSIDIGSHWVVDNGMGEVNAYRDIPLILQGKGHISEDLAEQWLRMIGFRNLVVHDYLKIDRKRVYGIVCKELSSFSDLEKVFSRLL